MGRLWQSLAWDSQFFRKRIAQTTRFVETVADLTKVLSQCHEERVDCVYHLTSGIDPEVMRFCEENGSFVGTRVELARHPLPIKIKKEEGHFDQLAARRYQDKDYLITQEIAAKSIENTRFFLDPRFPRTQVELLYMRWIEQATLRKDSHVFVAEMNREVIGFLALSSKTAKLSQIDLIATAKGMKRRGAGSALVECACNWSVMNKVSGMKVVTQGENRDAMNFYKKHSFMKTRQDVWFHFWLAERMPIIS